MLERHDEVLEVVFEDATGARVLAPANYPWHELLADIRESGHVFVAYRADDVTINLKPLLLKPTLAAQAQSGDARGSDRDGQDRDGHAVWTAYAQQDGLPRSELLLLRAIRELAPLRRRFPDGRLGEVDRITSVFEQLWLQRLSARVFGELETRRILPPRGRSVHRQVGEWLGPERTVAVSEVLVAIGGPSLFQTEVGARRLAWARIAEILAAVGRDAAGAHDGPAAQTASPELRARWSATLRDLADASALVAKVVR